MKLSTKFAERAINSLDDADSASRPRDRRNANWHAAQYAIASGVAKFQEAVEAGHLPRALPLDGAMSVLVALQEAGFKVTRNRRS